MAKDAVVFPGQGAQRPGMALDFVAQFDVARRVFERASSALGFDVQTVVREDEARLNLTAYTQPCILTAEIAMLETLKAHFGFAPTYFAGHSLGEYSALVASGALSLEGALTLVRLRGRLMQQAVPPSVGSMAALISAVLPLQPIEALCEAEGVDVANDNSPTQVVISGKKLEVERVCEQLSAEFGDSLRIVPLTVSAPFHSRHMADIEVEFRQALEAARTTMNPGAARHVCSNVGGGFHDGSAAGLIDKLTAQISGTVRWRDNMATLVGVSRTIFEVGPNRPLRGFFKALGVGVKAIVDVRSAQKAFGTPQEVV